MMKYMVSYFQVHSQSCGAPFKFILYTWSNLRTAEHILVSIKIWQK
jgi:hypothetical protein